MARCERCGSFNPPQARFCSQCAQPIAVAASETKSAGEPIAGERRQLTVLFCDLVGSTSLAHQLDGEDFQGLLSLYHRTAADVVERFGGHVAQYLGDGLMIYFGYPIAHEDSPRRAVQAAMEIVDATARIERPHETTHDPVRQGQISGEAPPERRLKVRIGIHLGPVVVSYIGAGAGRQFLALGETPHIAARLEALAEPGTVVISETVHRLIDVFFSCAPLGPQSLHNVSEPVVAYRVLGESGVVHRLDAIAATEMSRLVNRVRERATLEGHWQNALDGHTPVVLVNGEPGIGKSRQLRVLREHLGGVTPTNIDIQCSSLHQNSAFYPVVEGIKHHLGLLPALSVEHKLRKLEDEVDGSLGASFPAAVPILASLLSLPNEGRYALPPLSPQRLRQAVFEILLGWIFQMAAHRPTLLAVEDLQWADPSTLELLRQLVEGVPPSNCRLFTLLTARPEFRPSWQSGRWSTLELERLAGPEADELVTQVAGGELPADVLRELRVKADGVPLFVEEMTKSVIESGLVRAHGDRFEVTRAMSASAVPETLQDSLMARLDRLDAAKSVAQLAAVIGREFSLELLQAASDLTPEQLARDLDRLVEAQLVFRQERGHGSSATYLFKHALVQDTAYRSLLRGTRQQYHRKIAQALEQHWPEAARTQPDLLAQHYSDAGMPREGIRYWLLAGQRALGSFAHSEAISHFCLGIDQLKALPASPEHMRLEIELRAGLGLGNLATRGFAAKEVEEEYGRARDLCDEIGDTPVRVIYGIWVVDFVRCNRVGIERVVKHFQRLLDSPDPAHVLIAKSALGTRSFYRSDYADADRYFADAIALVDQRDPRAQHSLLFGEHGFDCLLWAHGYRAWGMVNTGRITQALDLWREMSVLAEAIADPYVRATTFAFGAAIAHDLDDVDLAFELSDKEHALAQEWGFVYWQGQSAVIGGWARARRGQIDAGIARLQEGLALFRVAGVSIRQAYFSSYLVELHLLLGRLDEGLDLVEELLGLTPTNVDLNHEPELLRLKGELLAARGDLDGAEDTLRKALALAETQGAAFFALKAATALARVLSRKDNRTEGAAGLARALDLVPEAHATRPAETARALLAQLLADGG